MRYDYNYKEGKDSTFTHLGKTYYVDDAIDAVRDEPPVFFLISTLDWIFDYDTPDPERTEAANIKIPIVVAKDNDGRLVAVDGLHRLAKAKNMNKNIISGRMVNIDDLEEIDKNDVDNDTVKRVTE